MATDTTTSDAEATDGRSSGTIARHIAQAAARLFASRGYDATSVREIVEAAGVTKPTLYYHFGSKEGLANALLTVPMTRLTDDLRRAVETEADPVLLLQKMMEIKFAFFVEDPDRARFLYALFFGPLGSSLVSEACRYGDEFDRTWLAAVRRLSDAGLIEPGRENDFTTSLRGLIVVSTIDHLYRGLPLGPGRARQVVHDLLHGFMVRDRPTTSDDGSQTR